MRRVLAAALVLLSTPSLADAGSYARESFEGMKHPVFSRRY